MSIRQHNRKWIVAIVATLLSLEMGAGAKQEGEPLESSLANTLREFARKRGLSDEQLSVILGKFVLDSRAISKGGLGKIGDDELYAVLDEKQNGVLIAGTEWRGRDSKEPQVVIIGDHRVLGSVDASGVSGIKVILFSPKQVRYVDLSNNSGAKYLRHLAEPAGGPAPSN